MSTEPTDPIRVSAVKTAPVSAQRRRFNMARVLRIIFPVTALGLVVIIFFPRGGGNQEYRLTVDAAALASGTTAKNPRLRGMTADGTSYVFRADIARPDSALPTMVELEGIVGEVRAPNGRSVKLSAEKGLFTEEDRAFRLSGGVSFRTNDGYQLKTDSVVAYSDDKMVKSDTRVIGFGPAGRFCAEQMTLQDVDGGIVRLDGDVVVILKDLPKGDEGAEGPETAPAEDDVELTICQKALWALEEAE